MLSNKAGGDTGAPEVGYNPIPRGHYHTDWVADRTIAYLNTLAPNEDWFIWMSFPDPHHPWDPPASEARRINWRDLDLPPGHPGSREKIEKILAEKPRHWLDWYQGRFGNDEGGAMNFVPCEMTHDQVREINALVHVKNEFIDEACARVIETSRRARMGHVTPTYSSRPITASCRATSACSSKGPYHVDALMRVPLIWRPAPSAKMSAAEITEPVGHLDLAPTFCAIAGVPCRIGCRVRRCRVRPDRRACARSPNGTANSRNSGCICARSIATALYAQFTSRQPAASASIFRSATKRLASQARSPTSATTEPRASCTICAKTRCNGATYGTTPTHAKLKADLVADLYANLPPARTPQLTVDAPA